MRVVVLLTLPLLCMATSDTTLRDRLQKNAKRPPWPTLPSGEKKKPLDVKIGIYIESLGKFMSTEMTFDIDLYLYMSWTDYTLNHTNSDYVLINDPKVKEHIWLPDLYFSNARSASFHDVTVPNFNLFIAQDGTIAYSSRITLTVACNLLLIHYPMDHQECYIRVLSYAYIANQVNVTWFTREPIRYNPEIGLPEFIIQNIDQHYCDGTYMYAIMDGTHKIDRFSCLEGVVHLRRSVGYHVVQSYIPTALIVVISWVSFWIDRRAVPARVTLSFTTLLSLSTLGNGLRFGLPMVSYAKSIDYWFGMCMIFVFCALLEFAIVNSYMRQANKYEKLSKAFEKRQVSVESDNEGPYIPSSASRHSYIGNGRSAKEEKPIVIPMSTFSSYRKKIALSRSNSSLYKASQPTEPEYQMCSVYTTTGNSTCNGNGKNNGPQFATLATIDMDDSMTMSQEPPNAVPLRPHATVYRPAIEESPTKTTFVSDDEWPEQLPVFRSNQHRARNRRPRKGRGHSENKTLGVNHFVQLGFLNSRKALRIDKLSRICFPLIFAIFNLFYWTYYLWYIPSLYP